MKFKLGTFIGALSVVVLLVVFSAGQAYASTGCFTDTNGHWAETFICWMKDNGITTGIGGGNYGPEDNVTRAQMAVFMQKLDELAVSQASLADAANLTAAKAYADASDATNLAAAKAYTDASFSTGDIYVTQALSALQPNGNFSSTARVAYYDDFTLLSSTGAGTNYYLLSAAVPTSLYGRALVLNGVQVCYDATPIRGGTLTLVGLKHFAFSGGTTVLLREIADSTARTDAACRSYLISSPLQLEASDHVSLNLSANFPSSFDAVYISSVSVILSPSTATGVLSPIPGREPIQDPALLSDPASSTGSNP